MAARRGRAEDAAAGGLLTWGDGAQVRTPVRVKGRRGVEDPAASGAGERAERPAGAAPGHADARRAPDAGCIREQDVPVGSDGEARDGVGEGRAQADGLHR